MAKKPVAKIERYAVVKNGETINVIIWDGVSPLQSNEGETLVKEASAPAYVQTLDVE